MHYLYDTEIKLRGFLHNVSCRLEPGGFYIGTTVDAEKVVALVRTEGKENMRISNDFYSIQFGQDSFPKSDLSNGEGSPYGLKFYFYLKDAVGKERLSEGRPVYVPEYLVSFDHLEKIALEYDLELVEKKNFHEFYAENIERNNELFQKMVGKEVNDKMSEHTLNQQWEICGLYLIFAFVKLGTKNRRERTIFKNYKGIRKVNVKDWR